MAAETSLPRSRRSLLAAAAGGLAALVVGALDRPVATRAAAGDPLILGQANDAGTSQTILSNAGLGAAFTLKSTNQAGGASGIFGWSSSAGPNATRGVYGKADGENSYGIYGRQAGPTGSGAAIYAEGNSHHGLDASTTFGQTYAVRGINASPLGAGTAIYGEVTTTALGISAGVRGANEGTGPGGIGVYGTHKGSGDGVVGDSSFGRGVVGVGDSYGVYSVGPLGGTSFIELPEISAPSNPAADQARLFVRDFGGKTQICALFAGGSIVVMAIEP